jgi:hypothetical protein
MAICPACKLDRADDDRHACRVCQAPRIGRMFEMVRLAREVGGLSCPAEYEERPLFGCGAPYLATRSGPCGGGRRVVRKGSEMGG